MPEYLFVENPFLDQLAALGWEVIDHGPYGRPWLTDVQITVLHDELTTEATDG